MRDAKINDRLIEDCCEIFNSTTIGPIRDQKRLADAKFLDAFDSAIKLVLREWDKFDAWNQVNGPNPFTFETKEMKGEWMRLMQQMIEAKSIYEKPMQTE